MDVAAWFFSHRVRECDDVDVFFVASMIYCLVASIRRSYFCIYVEHGDFVVGYLLLGW